MRRIVFSLVAAAALLATPSFAEKKVDMQTASIVPGAEGRVVLNHDRNKNIEVTLSVKHLAKPQRLSPAKETYIVWIQPEGQQALNSGVLRVNEDLKGDFRTTIPYKKFNIFVTAEDSPTTTTPSSTEIMRQQVQYE